MTVELFFLRHAIALEAGTSHYSEESRPLTEEGIQKMRLEVKGMKHLGLSFEALLSSPLTRAHQTAEIVKKNLPFQGKIEIEEELRPGGSLSSLLKKISHRNEQIFLLVGHEPTLSQWVQNLLGFDSESSLLLKKGGLCHLLLAGNLSAPRAELRALLPPRVLRLSAE